MKNKLLVGLAALCATFLGCNNKNGENRENVTCIQPLLTCLPSSPIKFSDEERNLIRASIDGRVHYDECDVSKNYSLYFRRLDKSTIAFGGRNGFVKISIDSTQSSEKEWVRISEKTFEVESRVEDTGCGPIQCTQTLSEVNL